MKKLLTHLRTFDLAISGFLLALIFVDIMLQVYSRLAPGTAPKWTVEMGSILLCALLWMGLGAGVQQNAHIRFDMVIGFFPPKIRKIFDIFGNVVFAAFLILLSYYTFRMLEWYMKVGSTTTILEWNKGWTKLPMLIGLLIATIRLLHVIVVSIVHFNDSPDEQAEGGATEGTN